MRSAKIMVRLLLLFLVRQLPAQSPDQGATPVFRSDTHVVEVTFVATRSDGLAVADLTADDLRVFDKGKEQKIASFDRMTPPAPGADGSNPRTRRLSVLLLDALNTSFSDQVSARMAATKVIEQLRPDELIAIFALTGNGLSLLHDFSSDAQSLHRLVETFRGDGRGVVKGGGPADGGQYSAEFSYHDLVTPSAGPAQPFRRRLNILDTLNAMTTVARMLKRLPGRKSLLWVSAGFPFTIQDPPARNPGSSPLDTESFHDQVAATMHELSAANVAIYPIDARGLSVNPNASVNIDSMKEMAQETGGRAFYNSNDIASEVRAALDDSRNAYVLTYNPDHYKADKSLHPVKLQTARRGVYLRYRPGYFAD